ncbi:MAG TPA: hypothetical protein VJN43_24065 [Bryobacteraceae bacterium]|nr:hypothetical protein [Bryobacteraceae bacterium]
MTVPQKEAADALEHVANAGQRSATAYRYQKFSPYLFLWGAIWIVGFTVSYLLPAAWQVWLALVPAGILASIWIDKRSRSSRGWKYGVECLAIFLFIFAVYTILPPRSAAQGSALFPLVVALLYVLFGVSMRAARITVLGFVLGALTVGGFLWLPQYFLLWMAAVGGGTLILGGSWLRTV